MGQSKVIEFLTLLLIVIGISSSIFTVHAATYTPGVSVGQWAKYETLYDRCQSSDPTMCQSQGNGDLNDTDYGLIRIVDVSGTTVTFQLFTQYKNGTTSSEGAQVDVATGYSNVSSIGSGAPSDYFVLAGGLQMGDHIWDPNAAPTAPTLNLTNTEQVLGVSRSVNFLNYTFSYSYPGGYSFSSSTGFAFDRASGVFLEISFSFSTNTPSGNSQTAFALGMVDNNIWLSSTLPDFTIGPISPITFQAGSSGTTTITLTGQNGFSSTISLSVVTASGLTCTLDHDTIQGSGTATMTCGSQPEPDNPTITYSVIIYAVSGYSTHSAQTTVTVWDFSIHPISSITFQTGSSGTATIGFIAPTGFSYSINLSVDAPTGLTCTLDHYTVELSGSATLTCNGQPGTYTVTINANGGGSTRSAQTTVTVTSVPDFAINPISSITFQTGSSGTATITFASQGGFSSSINLSVDAPSALTCTLDHYTVESSGSTTLTCNGQPGTYIVTINASGGGSTHSAHTNVTVNSSPTANQPSNGLPLTYVYIAVAVAAIVVAAGVIFFLRRKSSAQTP